MENREYKKVITYVKERIAGGELHSGDKLPTERELADILSVGRYSIREAIRIMDALGMIESRQGSGNYLVTNIEKNLTESMELMLLIKEIDYSQISKLRRAIELYAYGCALKQLSDSQLEELAEITESMKQNTGREKALMDKRFHDMIIAGSNNTLIISIMDSLSNVCSSLIEKVVTGSAPELQRIFMETHENMLKGLMTGDLLLGMQAVNLHYDLIDSEVSG
ncbi:GntR family transcriptional regulator, transcriptional repressor for pyruvate dehydrogenase complex [Anaerocolumna jejuensis DSM 15929]|uniref:GntR family transcriptional regulator, transcriptional repressor for pyruvate dehydrogenase complex n=1 Tax=Anaerocolumna jejuensis DSM 15929 TaxID=1121322 RepID=A0A1M6SK78_9FIRM|nr:GntR family transcriptional regulator [Anaerocolumna jejuensis]SHK45060.1 GntR family transcriptional regulator, transcriptional repressor for pyruvate dehydrogenase complex [Anaerocolumna jejuensis DSM 15929]